MSTLAVNSVTDANGGNTATINSMTPTADSLQGFRNRIINGDMRIDQRNAGAAVTITNDSNIYTVDRWQVVESSGCVLSAQQVTDAPSGFVNSHKLTVTTAAGSIGASETGFFQQRIEGTNVSDLAWGTASAKTITVSFWVKSSITGSFSGSIKNGSVNRSYPFSYTISSANTWEQKSVAIPGDTSGTWATDTGIGFSLTFDIGSGSSRRGTASTWASANFDGVTGAASIVTTLNATWQVTGVQLEVGSVATPFERRPYGTELALCQRYFEKSYNIETVPNTVTAVGRFGGGGVQGATTANEINAGTPRFAVQKRATPTITLFDGNGNSGKVNRVQFGVQDNFNSDGIAGDIGQTTFTVLSLSGATASGLTFHWTASSEL